jgi:uncharacterized repeat protein (TIGR03837 family)
VRRPTLHLFCRVVDNYGDAGVCWRLAREMVAEHALDVELFIDDVATLARIEPAIDPRGVAQRVAGVAVVRLDDDAPPGSLPHIVVEGFGCGLPQAYIAAMAAARTKPRWINLEYLSAEPWIDGAHALPSPHPRLPLVRYFWFPGFTRHTGGLLREHDLFARRDAWQAAHASARDALRILLFTYDNAALPPLLACWAKGSERIRCDVPQGVAGASLERWFGRRLPSPGGNLVRGNLALHVLPFTDQDGFDTRLWSADASFVRGEDSFVRAQWAARPFVWHAYRQADAAHMTKLDAFIARYVSDLRPEAQRSVRTFWHAFNAEDGGAIASAWESFRAALPVIAPHAATWATDLAANVPELAASLVEFARRRL